MGAPTARLFDAEGRDREVASWADAIASIKKHQLLWIDVDRDQADDVLAELTDTLGLDARELVRVGKDSGTARSTRTSDYLHLTIQAFEPSADGSIPDAPTELDIVAGNNVVVTVHRGQLPAIERYRAELTGETRLGELRAADLLSSIVDEVLGGYFLVVEEIDLAIDALDARALRGTDDREFLAEIVEIRRRIAATRRVVAPHREAFATLARPEMRVEERIGQPWPGLMDRLERALGAIDTARDALLGTFDIFMGRAAQRNNDVMKILTILSAILLPSLVMAGVMGMNFKLSLFEDTGNFAYVLAVMIGLAVGVVAIARLRRWI